MRHILIMVILLSLAIPVFAQDDDDLPYTIDSEGWFVTIAADGEVFYSNNEDIEPEAAWDVISILSPVDIIVHIQVDPGDNTREDELSSDPHLILGFRFGVWAMLNAFASNMPLDATYIFSDVETVSFDDKEFQSSSLTVSGFGTYTSYAYVTNNHNVFLNIYHLENTDITPAIELLETIRFQFSE